MQTINKFNQMISTPDLGQTIKTAGLKTASDLNCMRIGIVQEFFPEDLTAKVKIVNKKPLNMNADGTQNVQDFTPIYAKVCYCNPYETFPLKPGDECFLLFSDREIESWFITGDAQPEGHTRMHALTDAIVIVGLRSLPKMIQILTDALHLFYGGSDIQLHDSKIISNTTDLKINASSSITTNTTQYDLTSSTINITGTTNHTGTFTSTELNDTTAASNFFLTADGKRVVVVNGIVRAIV